MSWGNNATHYWRELFRTKEDVIGGGHVVRPHAGLDPQKIVRQVAILKVAVGDYVSTAAGAHCNDLVELP